MNLFQTKSKSKSRYYELDVLRGIAVLLMVVYHFCFDLEYFGVYLPPSWFRLQQFYGFLFTILVIGVAVFIGIAGVSLALSASITKDTPDLSKKLIKRGASLLAIGLLITAVTWIYPHDRAILFGVLHLIGLSTILAIPFLTGLTKEAQASEKYEDKPALFSLFTRFPWLLPLVFGIIIILVSTIVGKINGPIWLVPFGIHPDGLYMLDYEPLFPWFGVILVGIAVGTWLYPKGERRFSMGLLKNEPLFLTPFSFIGRHSLVIYLTHQPIILGILLLVGVIELGLF